MPIEMRDSLQQMIHRNHFQVPTPGTLPRHWPVAPPTIARPCAPPKPPATHRALPGPRQTTPAPPGTPHHRASASASCTLAERIPSAIARSKRPPSLGKSAGARFSVIRRGGNCSPELMIALRTRSLLLLHRRLGQADHGQRWQAIGQVDFNSDGGRIHANLGAAVDDGEGHGRSLR